VQLSPHRSMMGLLTAAAVNEMGVELEYHIKQGFGHQTACIVS
jgi:hypothetical protein